MPDSEIYHITHGKDWEAAQSGGEYSADSLATQGFIHASTAAQVVETADLFYLGQDGLVLLCINPSLVEAMVKYDAPTSGAHREDAGLFPHIYGPLNLDAVVRVVDFPHRGDGSFELPAALTGSRGDAPWRDARAKRGE